MSIVDAPEARPIAPETVGGAGVEVLKQGEPASYGRRMFGALGPSFSMTSAAAMHGLVASGPGKKAGSTPLESVEVCASRAGPNSNTESMRGANSKSRAWSDSGELPHGPAGHQR